METAVFEGGGESTCRYLGKTPETYMKILLIKKCLKNRKIVFACVSEHFKHFEIKNSILAPLEGGEVEW